jgi:cyclase
MSTNTNLRRVRTLTAIVAVGATFTAATWAQGPTPAAIAAMKVERVKDNLYLVTGSSPGDDFSGGNTAVLVSEDGITLVDTKFAGYGRALLERVRTISDKPIIRIISTHTHGDHTGNYPVLGAPMVETIVQQNARADMVRRAEFSGDRAQYAPRRTFSERLSVGQGDGRIDLYYFGPGHTNGDAFVVFPHLRTMHAGDMFAWKGLPYIDTEAGGKVLEHAQSLARAVATVKNVDTVIPGHSRASTWQELKEYADFARDFEAYVRRAKRNGRTPEAAAAEYRVPQRFKGYAATVPGAPPIIENVVQAYAEIGTKSR